MHDLLVFLYCAATNVESPTPGDWWLHVCAMVECLLPDTEPPPYDREPGVVVSLLHHSIDATSASVDEVVRRFLVTSADVGPGVWGPAAWRLVHGLAGSAAGFHRVPRLLMVWTDTLPCAHCRHHLKQHLEVHAAATTLESTRLFVEHLHDCVRQRISAPILAVT